MKKITINDKLLLEICLSGGSAMKLKYVHHIAIITSDYEKTIDFYVKKLGFKILRENHRQDRADIKLDLQFGDQELEIFVNPSAPKRPNYPEAQGLRHLAFKVKDIDEAVSWLNERGIETEPIRFDVFTQNRMTFFKDPDGLPLEIHE